MGQRRLRQARGPIRHRRHLPLLAACVLSGCRPTPQPIATMDLGELLAGTPQAGYARALDPRPFTFPADHGPHPDFATEWWYFVGTLATDDGREFGYQLTFFRQAVAPSMPARESAWATRQIYLCHFTVTDVAGRRFAASEHYARGAMGLAGAQAQPWRVWVEDWSAEAVKGDFDRLRLRANADDHAIDLILDCGPGPVLHGDRGLSRKGPELGNASYYYSFCRMPTTGRITVAGRASDVHGRTWLDREWSTSALSDDQVGWDWFALRLDDGPDLMLYHLRRKDGSIDPFRGGSLIRGSTRRTLPADSVTIAVTDHWTSPHSGANYPAGWRITVPSESLDLSVAPLLADQELPVSIRYWEGAVAIEGTHAGRDVAGRGYAELTGYDDSGAVDD